MKAIINFLRQDMKLQTKLFLNNLLLVMIPGILIIMFFYNQFYRSSLNEVLEQRRYASEKCAEDLSNVITRMTEISNIVVNSELLMILNSPQENLTKKVSEAIENRVSVFESVLNSHINDEEIKNIKIFTEEDVNRLNNLGRTGKMEIFEPFSEIQYSYWRNLMEVRKETKAVFSGYYLTDYERQGNVGLSFVNKLLYYKNGEEKSVYVVVYYDIMRVNEILTSALNLEGESAYIVDSQNIMVSFTNQDDLGVRTIGYENLETVYSGEKDFEQTNLADSDYYFRYCDIEGSEWKLEWFIPQGSPVKKSKLLLGKFILQYAVILLVGFVLSILISKRIMKKQIDKEVRISEELYEYRLQALRAQIDPHFLYNTLDMIKWMAVKGECGEIEQSVITLSKFYRLSLNKGNTFIALCDELEYVSLYVELMNKRFGGRIEFFTDVSDEILDCSIPTMIFQPIVENSIVHGILGKEGGKGVITIVGWQDETKMYFEVGDDGLGIPPDVLADINSGQNVSSTSGSGIGVYNTNRRLELLYEGKNSTIRYESSKGSGTIVHIYIEKERV